MKTNKKYITLFISTLLLLLSFFSLNAVAEEPTYINGKTFSAYCGTEIPETSAKSITVYNPESGFIIYEKNAEEKIFPASAVKIMTAIIAYEKIPDKSTQIEVTEKVVKETTGLRLGLSAGEIYTAEDLLRAVLICGSNDAANLLADYVSGGNKNDFLSMMNAKARELGCTSTNFTNVTGLHDPAMTTTASDFLKIAIYAYNLGEIAEWSSVAAYSFASVTSPESYKLRYNRNDFISKNNKTTYYYKNAFGLTSGNTKEAGNCLITAAQVQGMTYICVVMNSPVIEEDDTNYAYIDAKNLLNMCFDSYEVKKVLDTTSVISEVPVTLSAGTDHIQLFPDSSVSHLLPKKMTENDLIFEKIIYDEEYSAPITKGKELGELIVKYNDYIIGKSKLISMENIERSPILYTIAQVKSFVSGSFFIVTVITAIILFTLYTVISIRSRRRRRYWFR